MLAAWARGVGLGGEACGVLEVRRIWRSEPPVELGSGGGYEWER